MKNSIRRALAALLCCASLQAHALLVAHDSGFGTATLIEDTRTGTSWLRFDLTRGLSYNAVASTLDTTYAGYRLASHDEMLGLMDSLGVKFEGVSYYEPALSTAEIASLQSSFSLLGAGPTGFGGFVDYGPAWDPLSGSVEHFLLQGFRAFLHDGWAGYYSDEMFVYKPTAYADRSTFLVAAPVPEPGTYLLLAAGLGAAALRRRMARHAGTGRGSALAET